MTSNESQVCELKLLKCKDKFEEEGPMSVKSVRNFNQLLSETNAFKEVGMTVFEIYRFKRL